MASKRPTSTSVIVGLRMLLLGLCAVAAVSAFVVVAAHDRALGRSPERYACPMHAEIETDAPGDCPICHMALVPAARLADASDPTLSPADLGVVSRRSMDPKKRGVRAPAWQETNGAITALMTDDEVSAVDPGAAGSFEPTSFEPNGEGAGESVRRSVDPPVRWDGFTWRVRFDVIAEARSHRPGDAGWVVFDRGPREVLVVPSTAVLESSSGSYVIAPTPDGRTFTKRPVLIGKGFSGLTVVLSGLKEGEIVVGRNAFLPDAQRRLREALLHEASPLTGAAMP